MSSLTRGHMASGSAPVRGAAGAAVLVAAAVLGLRPPEVRGAEPAAGCAVLGAALRLTAPPAGRPAGRSPARPRTVFPANLSVGDRFNLQRIYNDGRSISSFGSTKSNHQPG